MIGLLRGTQVLLLLYGFGFPAVFVVLHVFGVFTTAAWDGQTFTVQSASSWGVAILAASCLALLTGLSLGFLLPGSRTATPDEPAPLGFAAMGCVMTPVSVVVL